jgi:hypothetical protein
MILLVFNIFFIIIFIIFTIFFIIKKNIFLLISNGICLFCYIYSTLINVKKLFN